MKTILAVVALSLFSSLAFGGQTALNLVSPHGGESFIVGQTQHVKVSGASKYKIINVDISRDGGVTFSALGVIDNTKSKSSMLVFTVAGPASSNCVIRVLAATNVSDTSGSFSISDAPGVSGPNGGDASTAGGDLTGKYPNPNIAARAVTREKVSSGTASSGMILKADGIGGADWAAAAGGSGSLTAGDGIIIGGTPDDPLISVSFGTTSTTVTAGNDARLSDARSPLPNNTGYIQNRTGSSQTANFDINGSGHLTGALVVDGGITTATATRYYSINRGAWVVTYPYPFFIKNTKSYATISNDGANGNGAYLSMIAPMNLPHGATITGFQVSAYGPGSGIYDMTVSLEVDGFDGVTSNVQTLQTSNASSGTLTGPAISHVVDNQNNSYCVKASWNTNVEFGIYGVLITYTVGSPLP